MIDDLDDDTFAHIIRFSPLAAIDLIIKDVERRVLVGLRNNEPAKDFYFVPGGRIRKEENIRNAFQRIFESEVGYKAKFENARLIGAYEHIYQNNRLGHIGYGTHYVVLAYEIYATVKMPIRTDAQHSSFIWMTTEQISNSPRVHPYTKEYFTSRTSNGA